MINNPNEIKCPNCGGTIIIDPNLLLQGGTFSCNTPNCNTSISLSGTNSNIPDQALRDFENLKQD